MVSGLSSRPHLTEVKPTSDHSDRPAAILAHENIGCNRQKQRIDDPFHQVSQRIEVVTPFVKGLAQAGTRSGQV